MTAGLERPPPEIEAAQQARDGAAGPDLDDFRVAAESRSRVAQITTDFNYAGLSAEIAVEARAAAARIKARMHAAVINVGADLTLIKDRLPHGEFGKWLKAEFNLTERTTQNYMNAAALAACRT